MSGTCREFAERIRDERSRGIIRPLLQSEHACVNRHFPGTTLEYCCDCGRPTGRAGKGDDSLYTEDGEGPFCPDCWMELEPRPEGGPDA